MKPENFSKAISIIMQTHSAKVIINYVKPGGMVGDTKNDPNLYIVNCVPAVVSDLIEQGFSLSMRDGVGLDVCDFKISAGLIDDHLEIK